LEEFKKISPQKKKEIEKIQKEEAGTIGDLNQAYITSRYLPVEFNKFQVDKMLKFTKKLIKFLKTYENAD
jgi:HEPN domain-containing protein